MTPLFKKLNLAETRSIHVLNAPESFEPELQSLAGVQVSRQARGKIVFAMAFVKTRQEVEAATESLVQAADASSIETPAGKPWVKRAMSRFVRWP